DDAIVVDAGCGTGTFGASLRGACVDVDRSRLMVQETRRRQRDALVVVGDVARLPVRDGAACLVRAERVLQWVDEPEVALAEHARDGRFTASVTLVTCIARA